MRARPRRYNGPLFSAGKLPMLNRMRIVFGLLSVLATAALAAQTPAAKPFTVDDLVRLKRLSDPRTSHDNVDTFHGTAQPVGIPHIANKVAQCPMARQRELLLHLVLLEFVTAEHHQAAHIRKALQNGFHERLAERTGTASDENGFLGEHGVQL